jgi:CII-binding regulator of phage lambda lysogenization HflD
VSKKLIITTLAGLISLGGGFAFAWFTRTVSPSPELGLAEPNQPELMARESFVVPQPGNAIDIHGRSGSKTKKGMTEQQLRSLVYEIQENMRDYTNRLASLQAEEQRLQIAHETLKKDIENLNNLRVELASMVAGLKSERDKLLKSRIEVGKAEKANLVSIAATYDKMDVSSAGKILTSMCSSEDAQSKKEVFGGSNSNLDDAVKILYYMAEKTKAKVLAELVNSEPRLTATLCERLKQVIEEK